MSAGGFIVEWYGYGRRGRIQLLDGGTRSTAGGLFVPEVWDRGDRPVKLVTDRLAGGVDLPRVGTPQFGGYSLVGIIEDNFWK